MFTGSYSVSPSLLTDKISIWQQLIDGYDIYSRRNHELLISVDWGFGQEGDVRVPENSIGDCYEGCKTFGVSPSPWSTGWNVGKGAATGAKFH